MSSVLINIDVPDIETATRFYQRAFDLKVGRQFTKGRVVELLGFPSPIFLLEKQYGSLPFEGADQVREFKRHWTPVHLDVVVDSIEAAVAKAEAAGAKIEGPIQEAVWGKLAACSDPFGHGFCLIEFIGKGYDELLRSDLGV